MYAMCTTLDKNNMYSNELCNEIDRTDIILKVMIEGKAIISFIELTEEEYYKIMKYLK